MTACLIWVCVPLLFLARACAPEAGADRQNLNAGWRFHRGEAEGAWEINFNDSPWRTLDLPHDWSIEDLPGRDGPFDPDAVSEVSGGFTVGGTGWYRKSFSLPTDAAQKRHILQFDGVYMNATVWLNGQLAGGHPYGYSSFWFDVTGMLRPGEVNTLAVKVENEGKNSRWYSGSGIYRDVWLRSVNPVHVDQWGLYVTTPEAGPKKSRVNLRTTVVNRGSADAAVRLVARIRNAAGREVARTETEGRVPAGEGAGFEQDLILHRASLWSTETPYLYTAVAEVYADGALSHVESVPFGIRSLSFDPENGFQLNGKTVLLKGGCIHHDHGPLGARSFARAEERKVELLKAAGFNALRSSHNPPAPALLDACDRLGILVIDEAFDMWQQAKNPFDYHLHFDDWWQTDLRNMVLRDRNHPSVIMWSLGNEIPEQGQAAGAATARMLGDFVRQLDPTRPVTAAVNNLHPDKDPFFGALDIAGYNYAAGGDHEKAGIYRLDHERMPGRIMYGSESYPLEAFGSWMGVLDHSWVIGDFVWTAFDYLGEASIGWRGYWQEKNFYPWNLAYCGDIDICGWKRPQSYYRDALWKRDALSVFVKSPEPAFPPNPERQPWSKWHWHDVWGHWNWEGYEGQELEVQVYSSCEEVELYLNGRSLGRKPTGRDSEFMAVWPVPYSPGSLRAVGYRQGGQVNEALLATAGPAAALSLHSDRTSLRADGRDLAYVSVELVDGNGLRQPLAENLVRFELEGPGELIAVGNAHPMSLESYTRPQRRAWQGRCLAVIRSGYDAGVIRLKARSEGLGEAVVEIRSR
jgi:beta-galactosidase